MSTVTFHLSPPLAEARTAPRKSLLKRFFDAMIEARMRQAMREIAMHRHLVPQDTVRQAGYAPTQTTDGVLPFVRTGDL